jgi:hypothetical protein
VPSLLIPIVLLIGCFGRIHAAPVVWSGFYSWFQILQPFCPVFPGLGGCVRFCFTSTESLILAQDERWRRA